MKKLFLCLLIGGLSNTISAQWDSYAWFQNQYQNQVIDFAFKGSEVWVLKPNYVMMLDTLSGEAQVFNDFDFAENTYFGSSTRFNSILTDENGTVYVNYYGIENGIYVYDGQVWTKHTCAGFPDQNFWGGALMMNSAHHLFIVQGKTLAEFDGTGWQTYPYTQGMYQGVVDSDDTLWLISSGDLISFYEGIFSVKIATSLYTNTFFSIAIDAFDNIYAPFAYNEILKFHSTIVDTLVISLDSSLNIWMIAADSNSFLYLPGYGNYYYKFDGNNWNLLTIDIPGNENIYPSAIGIDDQHRVWFGTSKGFLIKKENDFTSTFYSVNYSGLPDGGNYAINSFHFNYPFAPQGFLGTSEGLFNVNPSDFYTIAKNETGINDVLTDKQIRCVEKFGYDAYLDIDSAWFGTNEGLFGIDDDDNWWHFSTINSPLPNDTINYILYDAGKIWIATNGGVACYHSNGAWETFTTANSPLPANLVHSIFQDFNVVIFCTSNGVAYYDDPNWKIMNTSNSGLIDNDIQAFYTDLSGYYYYGTVSHGICDSTYNTGWNYFNTSTGLPSDSILFIAGEYGWGDLVTVGTKGGGILTFENGNYLFNTNNIQGIGFNDATDQGILQLGGFDQIWITTDKGLLYKAFGVSAPVIASQSNGVSAYFSYENLVISYELKQGGNSQFELFDINGKRLARVKSFGVEGKNSLTLPTSGMPSGIYILRMQSGNQFASVKAVKIN